MGSCFSLDGYALFKAEELGITQANVKERLSSVRKGQPRVSLVATDGITPPIWFGQGSDPEILGVVTVGVQYLVA